MPCMVRIRWRTPRSRSRTSSRRRTSTRAEPMMERPGDNTVMTESRTNIFDFDRASLERFFEQELGEKKFRAHQEMKWIHHRYATDFHDMTDLGKALRHKLEERAVVRPPDVIYAKASAAGTQHCLLEIRRASVRTE